MSILFVDESKTKGYTMVAAVVAPDDAAGLRREIRKLVLPGQRRIHFTSENDQRRRAILGRFTELGVRAQVFHCDTSDDVIGREACLVKLVAHAADNSHRRIVLERDESIDKSDRRILYREVRRHELAERLSYALEQAHQEPLLWIADAIAWSYTKGGDWRRRAQPLIAETTYLVG